MAATADLTVRLRGPEGTFATIGTDVGRGVTVEGLTCSANEWGPDSCGFTLRRDPRASWPDLIAFNQAEVQVAGVTVWGGRIWETPSQDGAERSISVSGRGWQYHLDDDPFEAIWVHTTPGDYRDSRSFATTTLGAASFLAAGQVNGGEGGGIQITFPNGTIVTTTAAVGVTLDLGPNRRVRTLSVDWDSSNNTANITLIGRLSDTEDAGSTTAANDVFNPALNVGASQTTTGTSGTGRRYVHLFLFYSGSAGTFAAEYYARLKQIRIFGDPAHASSGASILKASDVISNVLGFGKTPLLDSSTAGIETTSFNIPEFAPQGYQTARQILEAVNAYHDYLVGVDANRRLYFKARPSVPLFEIGDWTGAEVQDASMNAGEDLYNKVVVQYTGPDGVQTSRERTSTSSILTRQGFTRSSIISPQSAITQAGADQIGDTWLANHVDAPFKGSVTCQGSGSVRQVAGGPQVHPSRLLLNCGQQMRLTNRTDPADGSWGRDGIIRSVTYTHDGEQASVSLDNSRTRLDAFLARLAVITGQRR